MDLGLRDRICVVTGSTRGIGLETAPPLPQEGARGGNTGPGRRGAGAPHEPADLARPGEPERVIAAAEDRFGRVDCLVNNVGYAEIRRFDELTERQWEQSWQLNGMRGGRA